MTLTAGLLSQSSVQATTDALVAAAATGGTGPYTYQWYRSTTNAFTPGGGNIISGATALTLNDTGLIPNTTYYYKVISTDTGAGNATITSAQLTVVTTAPSIQQNAFLQSPLVGTVDLAFDNNVVSCQVDVSQSGSIFPGQAVKLVASTDGVPKVVACAANSDAVFGFVNFDRKLSAYPAGIMVEVSIVGSVIYLYSTSAISRGTQVQLDVSSPSSITAKVGSSGANICGWAYDQAPASGSLIRVFVTSPSFLVA